MQLHKRDSNQRSIRTGFTLVELLIVIIIIAVLAAVIVPKFANSGLRSKEATLRKDLKTIRGAIDLFYTDTGVFPEQLSDLEVATAPLKGVLRDGNDRNISAADWHGPYLEQVTIDPVSGGSYSYSTSSPAVGKVSAPAGTALDGSDYSTW